MGELLVDCGKTGALSPSDPGCYILVERSAQCELGGYNFDTLHIVLEAYTSDTL